MDWEYDATRFAQVDPTKDIRLRGQKALGRYRLRLEVDVRLSARPVERAVLILHAQGKLASAGMEVGLLQADGRVAISTATTSAQAQLSLATDLDLRQLTGLDGLRDHRGDLRLTVQIWGIARDAKGSQHGFWGQDDVVIPQSRWLDVLTECGFGTTQLLEVVVPRDVADPEMAAAIEDLTRASEKLLLRGGENDAVGGCRLALDACGVGKRLRPPLTLDFGTLETGKKRQSEDLSLRERMDLLRYMTRLLTHPPHHTSKIKYSYAEAQLILRVTTALIAFEAKHRDRAPEE